MKLHPNHPLPHQRRARAAEAEKKRLALAAYQQEQLDLARDIEHPDMFSIRIERRRFNAAVELPSHNWFSKKFLMDGPLRDTILGLSHMRLGFMAPYGEMITLVKRHIRNPVRLHLNKYVPWKLSVRVAVLDRDHDGDNIPDEPTRTEEHITYVNVQEHEV